MEWLALAAVVASLAVVVGVGLRRRRRPGSPGIVTAPARGPGRLVRAALGRTEIDWGEVEAALLSADLGVDATRQLVEHVQSTRPRDAGDALATLESRMLEMFGDRDRSIDLTGDPGLVVVVGANGSGKTTTIAKLAWMLLDGGGRPLLAAADTFRAAAAEQLGAWGDRLGVDVVSGSPGGDPAAVAFDALAAARSRGRDVVIVDTAGRQHSQRNLMDELRKIVRVVTRDREGHAEVLLVVDGSTGQNAIAQASAFLDAVAVTGVVVTKLDGSARGGMALAVEHRFDLPVKLIGVGEDLGDLLHFDPAEHVGRLLEAG